MLEKTARRRPEAESYGLGLKAGDLMFIAYNPPLGNILPSDSCHQPLSYSLLPLNSSPFSLLSRLVFLHSSFQFLVSSAQITTAYIQTKAKNRIKRFNISKLRAGIKILSLEIAFWRPMSGG